MRKIFFAAIIVVLMAVPIVNANSVFGVSSSTIAPHLAPSPENSAVILSSLDQVYPMGQYDMALTYYLGQAGYQVTTITNTNVTVDFLLNQLNNYSIVIWRTNTYTWQHIEYWYIGQLANAQVEQEYASDFAQGYMNGNAGILGVNLNFFSEHFNTPGMLSNVKLMIVISTDSDAFAGFLLNAGAGTVIFCNGPVSLGFGLMDDLTTQVVGDMVAGQTVYSAVYNAVSPYVQNSNPEDPLDTSYSPPFWFQGNATLTL
jgi:hypothetical protein